MSKKSRYSNSIEQNNSPYTLETLDALNQLQQIVAKHGNVSSYAFTRDIYILYQKYGSDTHVLEGLMTRLLQDVALNARNIAFAFQKEATRAFDFAIYYFLALYCKRKDKSIHAQISLSSLIEKFGDLFMPFPLSLEVKSWFARRTDQLDDAFRYDLEMIDSLDINTNAGVYNSFASSVCLRLEKEADSHRNGSSVFYWMSHLERLRDWKSAVSFMPQIIENWKRVWDSSDGYGKHYFVWGKLLMFSPDLSNLSPAAQEQRLSDAKQNFRIAKSCENSNDTDYPRRCAEYDKYLSKCDHLLMELNQTPKQHKYFAVSAMARSIPNARTDIQKPNEDSYIADSDAGIFLVADGVTRPHEEYTQGKDSIAAECASVLCHKIYDALLHVSKEDISQAFRNAMLVGNCAIRPFRFYLPYSFVPCCTFVGAIIKDSTLYYASCCDTVAILLRSGVKIQLTEHFNSPLLLSKYTKEQVYKQLHNNIHESAGFGIFNGDDGLKDFLHVSHIMLEPGDRIILASDGLMQYLHFTNASYLCTCTLNQLFEESILFDSPPFQKYGDDKTCIIIDIKHHS